MSYSYLLCYSKKVNIYDRRIDYLSVVLKLYSCEFLKHVIY